MAPVGDRPDLVALAQRAVELMVRLVGGRIELAVTQLRRGAGRAAEVASLGMVAGLALALALGLCAAALVVALAPLLPSLPARLLLASVPFFVVGGWAAGRAAAASHGAGSATDETDRERDDRQHEQDVDPRTDRVPADHPE